MADLAMVYITTDQQDNGAELRCTDHPDWWADADGTDLPSAVRMATDHFRDEHRVHVADCMCRGAQVIDQRCIPTARCPGSVVTGPSGTPAVCESAGAHAAHDLNKPASPYDPIDNPCSACGCDKDLHGPHGCTGDFAHCPCETWMPVDSPGLPTGSQPQGGDR